MDPLPLLRSLPADVNHSEVGHGNQESDNENKLQNVVLVIELDLDNSSRCDSGTKNILQCWLVLWSSDSIQVVKETGTI